MPGPIQEHGFGLGAQTELISPSIGVSSVLASYDAHWIDAQASAGMGLFGRENANQNTNVISFGMDAYFPIHRASRADFAPGGGVSFSLLDAGAGLEYAWLFRAGALVRIFVVPNVALTGSLGIAAILRKGSPFFGVGARPLGSAGFIYYFE